jgi:UPF0716 protein FxsA
MNRAYLFTVVGLIAVDLVLLVCTGWVFGWRSLLTFCFAKGLLGLLVIPLASWQYGSAIAMRLDNDQCFTDKTLAGVFLLLAGFLLLLPGLIINILGFILLFPSFRQFVVRTIRNRFRGNGVHRCV